MADTGLPNVFRPGTPTITNGNLSPLQLALAQKMCAGSIDVNNGPLLVNALFLAAMRDFSDSGFVSPIEYVGRTVTNPLPGITGYSYVMEKDEDIYVIRRAQDCGPEENRLEKVYIGKKLELAEGTFSCFGAIIRGGSVVNGGGGPWGTGGLTSPYPGPIDALNLNSDVIGVPIPPPPPGAVTVGESGGGGVDSGGGSGCGSGGGEGGSCGMG